ncbi:hypothetical protein Tsubulata_021347 [Turnera subulata]|uniref:Histone-lysine N-methyltransferase n=1 Tax=Turnera subulata TaxID=218843 RepID=A0A9Q0G6B5_9ROSI|nr:hypothetical protein Tsubulata_021347 [Turnera subulata]
MGSCEDPVELHEPLCPELIHNPGSQWSECFEPAPLLTGSDANHNLGADGRLNLSPDGNTNTNSAASASGLVEDAVVDGGVGLGGEAENVFILGPSEMLDEDVRGVSEDCLDERHCRDGDSILGCIEPGGESVGILIKLDDSGKPSGLMDSSDFPRHWDAQDEDKYENAGVFEDYAEGLCITTSKLHDEAVDPLGYEKHEDFIWASSIAGNTVDLDKQDSGIISETFPVMTPKISDASRTENESALQDTADRIDGLAAGENNTHHITDSSLVAEISAGLIQGICLPQSVSSNSSERAGVVMVEENVNLPKLENGIIQGSTNDLNDVLAAIENDTHDDRMPLLGCESSKELVAESYLHRNDVEKSNQESGTSAEMALVNAEAISVHSSGTEGDCALHALDEKNDSLAAFESETHERTPNAYCFYMSAESVSVVCSPSSVADQQKLSGTCSSLEAVSVVKEIPSIGTSSENDNQMSQSQEHNNSSESVPMKCPQSNCDQLEDLKDEQTIGCPFAEPIVEEKNNRLAAVASTDSNHVLLSQGSEMSLASVSLTNSPDESVLRDEQKQSKGCSSPSVEGDLEVKEDKSVLLARSMAVIDNQISSSVDSGMSDGDSLSNGARKNKHRDVGCSDGHLTESMNLEGRDTTTETAGDGCRQTLQMEREASELKEGLEASHCFEKPVLDQSCQSLFASWNGSSEKLDMSCSLGVDACANINSNSAVDCSRDTDDEGKNHARANGDGVFEAKSLHIASPPSGRSHRTRKSSRKAQTKRTVRKCRNSAKAPGPHGGAEIILEIAKKKRSCFSKPARSSEWGLLGNITQTFRVSNGLPCDVTENHGLTKPRVGRGTGQHVNPRTSTSSRSRKLAGKSQASTNCIRLKVKLGKDVSQKGSSSMVPQVVVSDGLESCQGNSFGVANSNANLQETLAGETNTHVLQCFDSKREKETSEPSDVDVLLTNKNVDGTMPSVKSGGDAGDNGVPTRVEVEAYGVATEKRYTDPGTSPDSEVINLVPEVQHGVKCREYFPDGTVTSSKACAASRAEASGKKAKKKDRIPHACESEDESTCLASLKKAKSAKKSGRRQKKTDGFSSEVLTTSACATGSSNSSRSQELVLDQTVLSRETETGTSGEDAKVETNEKPAISCGLVVVSSMSESQLSENLVTSTKSKGKSLPRKSGGVSKGRSKASTSARSRRASGSKGKGNEPKLAINKKNPKERGASFKEEDDPKTGNLTEDGTGNTNIGNNVAAVDSANLEMSPNALMEQSLPSEDAWVRCDDCYKWRRIPVSLVDSISEANCQWICKDNTDEAFADCSIPQEKSNAEINAELGISDTDADAYDFPSDDKALECVRTPASNENIFTLITANQFSHRSRKNQTIDEIMVCHCKPPVEGGLGCGDECLNRMLNIECVQGTCPCGDLCSNQQFQKRSYARMKWDRCGKKGFGLRMEDDISKGHFLIEYVGEVLDVHAYAARLKEYASKGHKHFYFMTLDGSEVIDACAKGNLGRFINHSCDPNCRTEKWVVNGEICIGLFALRDIKKGEEVTFDYNYVRVVGAAAKRCYCGSLHCRGYIGGDPTNTEVIDQVDSDEEFPEPVMLEDWEAGDNLRNAMAKNKDKMDSCRSIVGKSEDFTNTEDSGNQHVSVISQLHDSLELNDMKGYSSSSLPVDLTTQSKDVTSKSVSALRQEGSVEDTVENAIPAVERLEISSSTVLDKSSSENIVANRKSKTATVEDKQVFVKSRFFIKTSHQSGSVKKGKFPIYSSNANKVPIMANKTHVLSIKPRKLMEGTSNGHFEAVQEKLNELLDAEGGISKRKDAPKGYLKLLLLTAASGASGNGESIQSNRELSMILDALLKTKSRAVLMDVINKNGLRMLHNIMKQYRRDFKKIPILRKLLKVLEYLAVREILTLEHISGGPPFPGMESFAESMLSLTEHDDKQVHQIARNFRDRWIPRHIRKRSYMDRDEGRMEFLRGSNCNRVSAARSHWHDQGGRNTDAVDCITNPLNVSVDTAVHEGSSSSGTKTRKRKSRWDQPAEGSTGSKSLLLDHGDKPSRECNYCPHCVRNYYLQDGVSSANTGIQNIHEDVPPGFSSPIVPSVVASNPPSTVNDHPLQYAKSSLSGVVGLPQSKFISRLPVSYGIPLPIAQQFGSPSAESLENWDIAPGMPFYPFPPLPPLPTHKQESPPSSAVHSVSVDETAEQVRWGSHDAATCPNEDNPSTTGASQLGVDIPGASDCQAFKRTRGSSFDLGRRYFRQQKWNKMGPPWVRNRNGWGYIGDNSRAGTCSTDVGSTTNQYKNSYCSPDVSSRAEKTSNYFNQHAQHLNEH